MLDLELVDDGYVAPGIEVSRPEYVAPCSRRPLDLVFGALCPVRESFGEEKEVPRLESTPV